VRLLLRQHPSAPIPALAPTTHRACLRLLRLLHLLHLLQLIQL